MLLRQGHRFEPVGHWAIFEVASIDADSVHFRIGPSVSDDVWATAVDHVHVSMGHAELQRRIDAHLFIFDDPEFPWDDPGVTSEPVRYPRLQFRAPKIG